VTGDKVTYSKLRELIKVIKSITNKSIYVGFGIKSPEDARKIIDLGADGIIVGSAIARIYEKNIFQPESTLAEISAFVRRLKESAIF